MTSNIGSQQVQEIFEKMNEHNRYQVYDEARTYTFELLKKTIRPEFLNRIDDIIMFIPLGRDEVKRIVKLQFDRIAERLSDQGVSIQISEKAVDWISAISFDPQYGARPVKRNLQRYVLNDLSKEILGGTIERGKIITVDVEDDELVFKN